MVISNSGDSPAFLGTHSKDKNQLIGTLLTTSLHNCQVDKKKKRKRTDNKRKQLKRENRKKERRRKKKIKKRKGTRDKGSSFLHFLFLPLFLDNKPTDIFLFFKALCFDFFY